MGFNSGFKGLMSQLISDPLKCSILRTGPEDCICSLMHFDLGSLPTYHPSDAVTSQEGYESMKQVGVLVLLELGFHAPIRLKARCHGDSLRAGKSMWQVGYRVILYCH